MSIFFENFVFRLNDVCIANALVDDEFSWYRGVCVEQPANGQTELLLLDYGREVNIKIENIRKLPDELNFPVLTNECKVKGL